MSINVFKKLPASKITFSHRSIICGEHKVVGSDIKVIFQARRHEMKWGCFFVKKVENGGVL